MTLEQRYENLQYATRQAEFFTKMRDMLYNDLLVMDSANHPDACGDMSMEYIVTFILRNSPCYSLVTHSLVLGDDGWNCIRILNHLIHHAKNYAIMQSYNSYLIALMRANQPKRLPNNSGTQVVHNAIELHFLHTYPKNNKDRSKLLIVFAPGVYPTPYLSPQNAKVRAKMNAAANNNTTQQQERCKRTKAAVCLLNFLNVYSNYYLLF